MGRVGDQKLMDERWLKHSMERAHVVKGYLK
jgi:hypothetical protein